MIDLPSSEIYEQELFYMPYRKSLQKVLEIICEQSPPDGSLLDLMCGPGYLLGEIAEKRSDLSLKGVDFDERYINHAREKYSGIEFEVGDVLSWNPKDPYDVVICTGALHHIQYENQAMMIKRIASIVKPKGPVIISDCYIDDFSNEAERQLAAAKLGYEYMKETIMNGAPREVVKATADILHNDVMMDEFKTSLSKRLRSIKDNFGEIEIIKTWPETDSEYGDYIIVCR
jgi:2-polyprenyl-3-methyl-5-hydroxy-6-metoxy-1,4-benzoquinol methylase